MRYFLRLIYAMPGHRVVFIYGVKKRNKIMFLKTSKCYNNTRSIIYFLFEFTKKIKCFGLAHRFLCPAALLETTLVTRAPCIANFRRRILKQTVITTVLPCTFISGAMNVAVSNTRLQSFLFTHLYFSFF